MTHLVFFGDVEIRIIDRDGQQWLTTRDLARALAYRDEKSVTRLYQRHADEFTDSMTTVIDMSMADLRGQIDPANPDNAARGRGEGDKQVRIFSLRGAHLVAMFANTEVARRFRRFVLDLLERDPEAPAPAAGATVRPLAPLAAGRGAGNRLWMWRAKLWEALHQLRQLGDRAPYGLDAAEAQALPRAVPQPVAQGEADLAAPTRRFVEAIRLTSSRRAVMYWPDPVDESELREARAALLARQPDTLAAFAVRLVVLKWWAINYAQAGSPQDAQEDAMARQCAEVILNAAIGAEGTA